MLLVLLPKAIMILIKGCPGTSLMVMKRPNRLP